MVSTFNLIGAFPIVRILLPVSLSSSPQMMVRTKATRCNCCRLISSLNSCPNASPNSPPPPPSVAPIRPSSEFQLFSFLPLELRLEIWQHALPPPRTIPINVTLDMDAISEDLVLDFRDGPHRHFSISLLHACQESRAVVLRSYEPVTRRSCFYVDFARDSFRLSRRRIFPEEHIFLKEFVSQAEDQIRWLEIEESQTPFWQWELAPILKKFPVVREIRILGSHAGACRHFKFLLRDTAAAEKKFDKERAEKDWSLSRIVLVPDDSQHVCKVD